MAGCASAPHAAEPPTAAAPPVEKESSTEADLRAQLATITSRLDSIETRMGSLNDKVIGTQGSLDMLMANKKAFPTPVLPHPSEGAGTEPPSTQADNDPEAGFVADTAIQDYRKGSILLEAGKYSEAILAFTSFVEHYPDHPLAGSAQFGIGEAYFKKKEYKLALRELERVLTSYDRSPHVSDTLRDLAASEDALGMTEQASRHRQLLSSLFPQSPAASRVATRETHEAHEAPETNEAPHAEPAPAAPSAAAHPAPPTAPLSTEGHP